MKALIVLVSLLIAIQATTGTIDVQKLKETAAPLIQTLTDTASTKLQTFTDTASTKLHTLTDTASTQLQNLKEKAAMTLHQLEDNAKTNINEFIESIDLEKLKKLDFLNIVPRVHDRLIHKHFPTKEEKLKFYLKNVKGLKQKDPLVLNGEYPWVVVTRRVEYIYE